MGRRAAGTAAASRYAHFFDIDWDSPDPVLNGKVLAPFLGEPYGEALRSGALTLERDGRTAGCPLFRQPLSDPPGGSCRDRRGTRDAYDPATESGQGAAASACWSGSITGWPGGAVRATRSTGGGSSTSMAWPDCGSKTRRFSRRHMPRCCDCTSEGLIDGVRVDHVDGLADPPGYCRTARALRAGARGRRARGPAGWWWKRSLAPASTLPDDWGVDGTSGYDFMDVVSALLHDPRRRTGFARPVGVDQRPIERVRGGGTGGAS